MEERQAEGARATGPSAYAARWSDLADKVVMVTGAASGIGRATALAFAAAGARLAITDRNAAALATLADAIGTAHCHAAAIDVCDAAAVGAFVDDAVARFGTLDIGVNAAGLSHDAQPADGMALADFDRVMAVNVRGVLVCMQAQIRAMRKAGSGGSVVNIASGAGLVAVPGMAAYVASKHAVLGMTKTAALDHAADAIRVNALCPGFTRTPMALDSLTSLGIVEADAAGATPLGRMAEPAEQAEVILFLASPRASFVTGHAMVADGGHSIQ